MLGFGFRSSKRGGIDAMLGVPEFLERGNRCYALGSRVPRDGEYRRCYAWGSEVPRDGE
jgi:hypothetical protein